MTAPRTPAFYGHRPPLTLSDAAICTGKPISTVRQLIKDGVLQTILRPGDRTRRVTWESIDAYNRGVHAGAVTAEDHAEAIRRARAELAMTKGAA